LTPGAVRDILASMPLAFGGLFAALIIVCGLGLFILAGVAIWKMRSDDFWEEPPG
jgi:hypothetical protein